MAAEEEGEVGRGVPHQERLGEIQRVARHDIDALDVLDRGGKLVDELSDSRSQAAAEFQEVGNQVPGVRDHARVAQALSQAGDVAPQTHGDRGDHARDLLLFRRWAFGDGIAARGSESRVEAGVEVALRSRRKDLLRDRHQAVDALDRLAHHRRKLFPQGKRVRPGRGARLETDQIDLGELQDRFRCSEEEAVHPLAEGGRKSSGEITKPFFDVAGGRIFGRKNPDRHCGLLAHAVPES